QANAIIQAADAGGIAAITFRATGVTAFDETRTIDPAQAGVVASFKFGIPANARPGDLINVDATAVDKAGNSTDAARVVLPIADLTPPTVHIRPANGLPTMSPGNPITVIVDADDESSVKRIDLAGDGGFTVADSRQISPPTGSAQAAFTIHLPPGLSDGLLLNLQARASDTSDNVSEPALLSLTALTLTGVTLPPSVIVIAGESVAIPVQLSSPAPAGGLRVDFTSRDANVALVTSSITFAAGESAASISV